jgi:hypothetical protein
VAFEAELVLQRPDDGLDALAEPVRERVSGFLVLPGRADQGQVQVICGQELLEVFPGESLAGHEGGAGAGRLAGCSSSMTRTVSRSPSSFGLARANPVTVPSQVMMSSSFAPQ